jgi:hypothetical protein
VPLNWQQNRVPAQPTPFDAWLFPNNQAALSVNALKIVTGEQVQALIDPWLDEKLGPVSPDEQAAIDAKTLKHSGVHLVTAVLVRSQRCVAVKAGADKSNEITALRQLIDQPDLEGCLDEVTKAHQKTRREPQVQCCCWANLPWVLPSARGSPCCDRDISDTGFFVPGM